jgi:hypothetical protein
LFEEKIGGADLGDVFSIVGDVLTLVLASAGGLTKSGNELAIDIYSTGGMQTNANGLSIKILSTGGMETDGSGLGINLDGDSLSLSASGLKVNANLIDVAALTASRLLATDASKTFVSSDIDGWIAGTADQITVSDDGDGSVTLSTPQSINTTSSPTFADITITDRFNMSDVEGMIYYQRSV